MITENVVNAAAKTVFVNTQRKATKRFEFIVILNSDGSYHTSQQAFRVYPSGREEIKSTKSWVAESLQVLRNATYLQNRQGRIFLSSLAIH